MTAARSDSFKPDWAKPQNWPARRRAPGYPWRFLLPSSIVLVVAIGLVATGLSIEPPVLVGAGIAFFLIGHAIVYRFTLSRFCCPDCGRVVTLKGYPAPGAFFRFHCRECNTIWLTGVRVNDDVGA